MTTTATTHTQAKKKRSRKNVYVGKCVWEKNRGRREEKNEESACNTCASAATREGRRKREKRRKQETKKKKISPQRSRRERDDVGEQETRSDPRTQRRR